MAENFILSGFSDEIDADITLQFEGLKKLNMKHFEIRGVCEENIADLTLERAKEVKALADRYGIKVSSIGSPIGKISITDPMEPHIEKLKHVIKLANIFETKYIRIFSFFMPKNEEVSNYRDEVITRMKMMTKVAEESDVILLHENEKGIYGDIASRCKDILDSVDSPNLRAVFDPANFVQCGQVTYPDAYNILRDKVVYIHIKDAIGEKVVPPGEGNGKIPEILQSFKNDGYKGFVSLEPHLAIFSGLAALEEDGNTSAVNNEKAGLKTFKIAYDALNKIINDLK